MLSRPIRIVGLAVLAVHVVAEEGPSGGSVQKVISMLEGMAATAKQEKNEEEVAFAKFSTWCDMESVNLQKEIKKDGESLESLTAEIGQLTSDVKGLGKAIGKLEKGITSDEADKKAADEQRKKDHASFSAEEKDYSESTDALDRAIAALSKEDYDRPAGAAALLELSNSDSMPMQARSTLASFVTLMSKSGDSSGAPEANGYEFQSGGIVDMLKKLQDEFRAKLGQCQKEEMNSEHAYNMVVQDLTDSIANAKKDSSEKSQEKSRKTEKIALDKQQVEDTTASKAEAEKTLSDMTVECKQKKLSFGEKQQLRGEEIEAIEKAAEIMSSPEAAGGENAAPSFSQTASATALPQLRSAGLASGVNLRVREFLKSEGVRLHSQKIGLLAEKMSADPFVKVKQMIDGMITRLMEEAKEDADKEGFCDMEIGKSKITRNKLTEDINGLEASVDEGKSTVLKLTETLATITQEVAELDGALKEAGDIRAEEKAKNAAIVKDAKAGAKATQAATNVLKEFYEGAAQATGFVQVPTGFVATGTRGIKMGSDEWAQLANPAFEGTVDKGHKEGMQTFGKTYTGQQGKSGGVLALLEVILSDFATLEAETTTSEAESQSSYDKFVTDSTKGKAMKEKQIEMDTADKAKTQARVQEDTADMKATQDELLAAERYYEKLVPQCIDQGQTFEERTAARESEISSLKEALKLLSGGDIA